jgi:hypothetical protein
MQQKNFTYAFWYPIQLGTYHGSVDPLFFVAGVVASGDVLLLGMAGYRVDGEVV